MSDINLIDDKIAKLQTQCDAYEAQGEQYVVLMLNQQIVDLQNKRQRLFQPPAPEVKEPSLTDKLDKKEEEVQQLTKQLKKAKDEADRLEFEVSYELNGRFEGEQGIKKWCWNLWQMSRQCRQQNNDLQKVLDASFTGVLWHKLAEKQ